MKYQQQDRTLSLAALFQVAWLVDRLAYRGLVDQTLFEVLLQSILIQDAPNTESIFGNKRNLRQGLEMLRQTFEGQIDNQRELLRYVLDLATLSLHVRQNSQVLAEITAGLAFVQSQRAYFSIGQQEIIESFANLYKKTLSPLRPKIMVRGSEQYLSNPEIAAKIRALLLAGVRCGVLWYQVGGSRWHLIFERTAYLESADDLLNAIREHPL